MKVRRTPLLACALLLAAGCEAPARATSAEQAQATATVAALPAHVEPGASSAPPSVSAATPPPAPEGPFVEIAVSGQPSAIVSVPDAGSGARQVVVATHGNFNRPEWQCEILRGIAGTGVYVLCPRGRQRPDSPSATDVRFTYSDNARLEAEVHAGLDALRARYGASVASGPAIYTGFSLGAIMGVAILTRNAHPGAFDRALFVEGGYDKIDAVKAKGLFQAGVRRVLFACGQAACLQGARAKVAVLERAGVAARVVGVKSAGHSYDGPVAAAISAEWAWFSAR